MDKKFVDKCLDNWRNIVEYIESEYENVPISKELSLCYVPNLNQTMMFELKVREDHSVCLFSTDQHLCGNFDKDFSIIALNQSSCSDLVKGKTVEYFCLCIERLCKDWESITKAIEDSKEGYNAVMNFDITYAAYYRNNYYYEISDGDKLLGELTVPCVKFSEAKTIAKGLYDGLKLEGKSPKINVAIEGDVDILFSLG